MSWAQVEAAKKRWAGTTKAERTAQTEPMRAAAMERRARAFALLRATETVLLGSAKQKELPS